MTSLEYELADLQCLESCAEKGFTIQEWIEHKKAMIEFLEAREAPINPVKPINTTD